MFVKPPINISNPAAFIKIAGVPKLGAPHYEGSTIYEMLPEPWSKL
jgi:hypothetical protein